MISKSTIEERIRNGIATELGYEQALSREQSLRKAAVFDSVNILEFVLFLERTFSISIESDDMVLSTFETIDNLVNFVCRKMGGACQAEAA